jgi:hypothetical protein
MLGHGVRHCAVFVHDGMAYEWKDSDMDKGLRVFNAYHYDTSPGVDTAQVLVVNAGYVAAKLPNPEGRDWFVTEIERKDGLWRASDTKAWKHTLDVLRRDHDEDLVVAAAKEEVVENLAKKHRELLDHFHVDADMDPVFAEWKSADNASRRARWLTWLESAEGVAAAQKRKAEIRVLEANRLKAAPWGGAVVVVGEKRKATDEPERTS